MFSIFKPRYLKEGEIILKNARKLLHYKRDLLSGEQVAEFTALAGSIQEAMKKRDEKATREQIGQLEKKWNRFLPPERESGWRENCEVFLVAIIIAIGVRSYFIQPFTIPTGSMQPTLSGITGTPITQPIPNLAVRLLHSALYGRGYVDVVSAADEEAILNVEERKALLFFTVTELQCTHNTYKAWTSKEALLRNFHLDLSHRYKKGEVIVRGFIDTGDHVFVDKFSYHFRTPRRGEVFVFSTKDIRGLEAYHNPAEGSQYYIKRLAGLPGDTLRIESPRLYVNGALAREEGFQRVMSEKDGYRGYGQGPAFGLWNSPEDAVRLPARSYAAFGDNSYNSLDSRFWGFVPERNLMGNGLFVYWPFGSHWGLIK